jgi:nicotinic acid phosphoribosyltransferase
MNMDRFYSASDDEIKTGETTDIYFLRTQKILEAKGLDKIRAVAEVTTGGLQRLAMGRFMRDRGRSFSIRGITH